MTIFNNDNQSVSRLRRRIFTAKGAKTLMGVMALVLSACSGHEALEPTPEPELQTPISFSSSLPEGQEVTRANLETYASTFKVWAYKNDAIEGASTPVNYTSYQAVMPSYTVNYGANTAFTTTSNTHDWEYVGQQQGTDPEQTIKYWDMDAKAYRFFAYTLGTATSPAIPNAVTSSCPSVGGTTPVSATLTATVDSGTDEGIAAAPYFSRLWFSDGNPTNYPNRLFGQPVNLEFLKPFARVRFMFTFMDIKITRNDINSCSFKPTDASKKIGTAGTVTVTYPLTGTETTESWSIPTVTSTIDAFTLDYYEPQTLPDPSDPQYSDIVTYNNSAHHWYNVLPAENQGSYTIATNIFEDRTAVVPAEYMNWKAGYEYTYIFKITEDGGIFLEVIQVGIRDWTHASTPFNHPVYNW